MEKFAVIVAGGAGLRAGGEVPKQFQKIGGVPMLWWSVRAFHREDPKTCIRLVLHPGFFDLWDILHDELPEEDRQIKVEPVCGGRSRLESVANGIRGIETGDALIAVHDAARPGVTAEMIREGWKEAEVNGAAVPVLPMADSLRRLGEGGRSESVDRSRYVRVQTPQVFRAGILRESYSREPEAVLTDDASVVEAAGHSVTLFPGDERAFKVTNPCDFRIAELYLSRNPE